MEMLNMRIDRTSFTRSLAILLTTMAVFPAMAQEAATRPATHWIVADNTLIYAMLVLAVVQVIFIVAMAGIMRTMSGPGAWAKWLAGKGGKAAVLVPVLMLVSHHADAQAHVADQGTISNYGLFWMLAVINAFLFIIMLVQMNILRGLTKAITGTDVTKEVVRETNGPSWVDELLKRLTKQVEVEKEKDIIMHHEYDGIRELDNVLPPWWLWLFYFTIGWGVVYLFNIYVINVQPDQTTEYEQEMEQAKADVAAYMATLKTSVDETNVAVTDDAGVLANGKAIFTQYCTPCHGADACGSETSVGPNLTDAYWLHGGDVKDIFKTVKYGVPEKGMISWKSQIKPVEIAAVVNYVISLKGTGGPTQKAPQGELWTGSGALETPADTAVLVPDTASMAAR